MSKNKQLATMPVAPTPAMGDNRKAMQEQMFKEIDDLAQQEGAGVNSRAELGIRCVGWSANGMADVGDAKPIYDRYISNVQDIAATFGGLKIKRNKESGEKQNISKIRQFLKMGGLRTIDPVKVINHAAAVVKDERLKGTITYGPFDALLNIARAQCASTQTELSREEMLDCNRARDKGDVIEADSLGRIKSALESHAETFGDHDETTEALEKIDSRIEALGGTTAQKKQKERAEKEAEKKANKVKRK